MVATKDKSEALRVECVSTASRITGNRSSLHWTNNTDYYSIQCMCLASSNVLVLIWENTNTIRLVQITFLYYTNKFCNFDKYNVVDCNGVHTLTLGRLPEPSCDRIRRAGHLLRLLLAIIGTWLVTFCTLCNHDFSSDSYPIFTEFSPDFIFFLSKNYALAMIKIWNPCPLSIYGSLQRSHF